jgi:hypothetical protein
MVFQNRVLRRIFGSKREELTGRWIKLHNEELNNLSSMELVGYLVPHFFKMLNSYVMQS